MSRRIILILALCILVPALLSGCPSKETPLTSTPLPEVTLSPEPEPEPKSTPEPITPPEPTGTIATIPEPTPTPTTKAKPDPTPSPTPTPAASSTPLTILSIIGGNVYVMKAGAETWEKAEVGTTLEPGDTVRSAKGSNAEVTFFDGSTIELEELTQIAVSELGIADNGSTTIRLTQQLGKTISRVKKLVDPASRFEVETPAAVAVVRGSIMGITVEDDGTTTVANISGDIRIIVDGKEYIIHEGMKRTIIPGQPPGPEVPITPPSGGGGGGGGGGHVTQPQGRMEVTVQAEPPVAHVGDIILYTYHLRNTGDLPLDNISVSNDISGDATYQSGDGNTNSVLDPNETWLFTSTYMVRATDPSPLIATTTVSALTLTEVTVIDTEIVTTPIEPNEPDTGIVINKMAEPLIVHQSDNITYYYYVLNTSNMPLMSVMVTDSRLGIIPFVSGDDNQNGLLDVDEIWVFIAIHTTSGEDPDLLINTAEASGMDEMEETRIHTDNASVSILRPGITLLKTAEPLIVYEGDNINYTYTVINTGNTPLSDISLIDDHVDNITLVSGDDNQNGFLDIDEIWIFTGVYITSGEDPDLLVNTAEVSGTDALEQTVTDSDNATVSILRPGITITKTAEPSQVHEGDFINYTYTVNSTCQLPLSQISVIDDRLGSIPLESGDDNQNGLLDPDEIWVFTANYTPNAYDPDLLVNTAEVSGMDELEQTVTDSDNASVSILRPGIDLVKTADPLQVHNSDNITYTYTVTNTGNTPLSDVSVTDDILGSAALVSGDDNQNGLLDIDETWIFSANYTVCGEDTSPLVNIAEASGTDSLEQTVFDSDTASVSILRPGIDLVKTADPWDDVCVGENVTYTYTVTNTGNTPLSDISVIDDRLGAIPYTSGDDNQNGLLDIDETWIFTAIYTVTGDDECPIVNTAVVSGKDELLRIVTAEDTATVYLNY